MEKTFVELKLFQVKPDKLEQFEAVIERVSAEQMKCDGCVSVKYFKRFLPSTESSSGSRRGN